MTAKTVNVTIIGGGGMCAIPVPFDPKDVFGKVRAPVRVTVNGFTFRSTISRMCGEVFIPLRKSNRVAAAVKAGDCVSVRIESDTDPRVVDMPPDLANMLEAKSGLMKMWTELSYTDQRECVESVLGAKRSATRVRRIESVVRFVLEKP